MVVGKCCRPPGVIDSTVLRPRRSHRPPPSCRSLPARSRVRKRKTVLSCGLGFRLWTACQILQPTQPAFPSILTVSKPHRAAERWLDGYRRVLSTAAQGKLHKPTPPGRFGARVSAAGRRARGPSEAASAAACWVFFPHCSLRANVLTANYDILNVSGYTLLHFSPHICALFFHRFAISFMFYFNFRTCFVLISLP